MTTITPRELRKGECWMFRAYGSDVEVGWNGNCWAVVDGERFGPFGSEGEGHHGRHRLGQGPSAGTARDHQRRRRDRRLR